MGRTSCSDCVKVWQAYDKPTPCKTCLPPTLEINQPFLELYSYCSDQLIMGPSGGIGLNLLAVDRAMDFFEIDEGERKEFYSVVRRICSEVLQVQYKDQEAKMKAKK